MLQREEKIYNKNNNKKNPAGLNLQNPLQPRLKCYVHKVKLLSVFHTRKKSEKLLSFEKHCLKWAFLKECVIW